MSSLNAHSPASGPLPQPTTLRWQPLRLGVVDLFYYDDEQFWFHDGRLLLRGNNGTGKSKVLALTLPFVLDGSIHPRRVEPDADPSKRMDWNLLLGGAHKSSERTGYSWVEFGRRDDDGSEHFLTLGIGMKAAAGRGIVKTWYFTSTRRIGDLKLVGADRVVLTQERLRDELAASQSGQVFTTQISYRRAVDEELFRLGPQRYTALIDLLVQLRQPQLSKNPDSRMLSAALSEALRPLDQAVLADVAESFRSLEEERTGIESARDTLTATEAFLKDYRAYARVAARRRASAVRESNSSYEQVGRDLREADAELASAVHDLDAVNRARQNLQRRKGELDGERLALQESPAMKDARRLDDAEHRAQQMEERAESADRDATRARHVAERDSEASADASAKYERAAAAVQRSSAEADRLASAAGVSQSHDEAASTEAAARRIVERRREQLRHVRGLLKASHAAGEREARERNALDRAETELARRTKAVSNTESAAESASATYRDSIGEFAARVRGVVVLPDDLANQVEAWSLTIDGESPARTALETGLGERLDAIAHDRAEAERRLADAQEAARALVARIAELERGHDPEPAHSPWRGTRDDHAGEPLWKLTDFAEGVPETDRAGIEAALLSAGILDAWVFPDGTLRSDDDVVLGPSGPSAQSPLGAMLVPAVAPDSGIQPDTVAAVLSRIGVGENSQAALWIDQQGNWGAGPARGSWRKEQAEFIGAGAREAHRRATIATLREELSERKAEGDAAQRAIAEAQRHRDEVVAARETYPHGAERALISAHERVLGARREADRAERDVGEARGAWEQSHEIAEQAAVELRSQAAELGLGTSADELDETATAVVEYGNALTRMRDALTDLSESEALRDGAIERAEESAGLVAEREAEFGRFQAEAAALRAAFETLHKTVGSSVAELQARLHDVNAAAAHTENEIRSNEDQRVEVSARRARAEQKIENLHTRRTETAQARDEQAQALRAFAVTGLLRVALPELEQPEAAHEWTVTGTVAAARTAEQLLESVDDSDTVWANSQQRVSGAFTELQGHMGRHGHTASLEQNDTVMVARVRYFSEEVEIDLLATRLSEDIEERERLLSAREREILENHLVNEVAGHLHELLIDAEGQLDRMNRELASRKTSTGMQLRVRWRERRDGPAGLADVRDRLLRSDATWSAADRGDIGDFLHAQILEARIADPAGGWLEHLDQALDYRQWHDFVVEMHQNGQWRAASGPASGGEKALAVTIPLFAAATAHYNSADSRAPRLILLDEAFVGVDDDARAKVMGLLATFDLDVVMTSEREWGCYRQVPGLAIAQLSRVEGIDAVGVTRWQWDGRDRTHTGEIDDSARASYAEPPGEPSLFD